MKIKPKKKDILLGVTQEELNEALNIRNVEHDIDEEERFEEEEEEESLRNRQKYRQEVQSISSEMKLIKNKLRFMVEDFS